MRWVCGRQVALRVVLLGLFVVLMVGLAIGGMPDDWEGRYGLKPADAADGNGDADGYANLKEYLNGTDPS